MRCPTKSLSHGLGMERWVGNRRSCPRVEECIDSGTKETVCRVEGEICGYGGVKSRGEAKCSILVCRVEEKAAMREGGRAQLRFGGGLGFLQVGVL